MRHCVGGRRIVWNYGGGCRIVRFFSKKSVIIGAVADGGNNSNLE